MQFFRWMNAICQVCRSTIPLDDINVSTDLALCRNCGTTFAFSELLSSPSRNLPDLTAPPAGAWFERTASGFRVGATTRSWMALFLIPFTCVWAGGSLGGIYGGQLKSGHFDAFGSLFGIPFVIGSFFLVGMCAMGAGGKCELYLDEDRLTVFTGVGPLGWARNYQWSDFAMAREEISRYAHGWHGRGSVLVLQGKRKVSFGSMWSEERRYFVLTALRQALVGANALRSSL